MEAENSEFIPLEDVPQTEVINFNVNDANIAKAKEEFKDVDAYKDIEAAKAAKKVLTKMRTTLADAHKEQKAESLEYGRTLDAEKNRLLASIAEIEDPIKKDLEDIKNEAETKEAERLAVIMSHIERLQSYSLDRHDLNLEQIKERRANLASEVIEEERYQEQLNDAKMAAEESDTKLRIVLQRELDDAEEREKQEKIAAENKRTADALAERQAKMDAEDAERKAEQEKKDAAARDEQAAQDAARQAKIDEQQAELDRKAKEQDERDRIAREETAEKDRQAQAEKDAAAALARAPDREKLEKFAQSVEALIKEKPTMASQEGSNTMLFVCDQLIELVETIRSCVGEMK